MRAALIVLDGWGLGPSDPAVGHAGEANSDRRDAVWAAETPTFDQLRAVGAFDTLRTYGDSVGLPDGQMGNSEVGHLTIGAGRVVKQESARITEAVRSGTLGEIDAIDGALRHADANDGRVHLMGLVGDGGVHAMQEHLHALIGVAANRGVPAVTHAFTDGRDTAPTSGAGFLESLEHVIAREGTGEVATIVGRYYAMDRDEHWDRTRAAYDAIVNRQAPHQAPTAVQAVEASYDRGETDEYVEPTLVDGGIPPADGDVILSFNFRADRARQLIRLLANIRPEWPFETAPPDTHVVTMTEYDRTFDLPVAVPARQPADTLGEVLATTGQSQLRIAESEKYAHVTYFLNGGREVEFEGEHRHIVDSPAVSTYDQQPAMSAPEVTDAAIDIVEGSDPAVLVLNYANPDMVGHTGNFEATVRAVEAVDEQLQRLLESVTGAGGHAVIIADHGNADDMGTPDDPHTAHTKNPVPFCYLHPDGTDGGHRARSGGTLADVAPTVLSVIDVDPPATMTGRSLLE